MESRATKIYSNVNKNAIIRVIPGHFATTHSHINYYVDMTIMKSRKSEAEAAASVLARKYSTSTYIDTIICMDGCEVIGAYLADELTKSGIMSLNQHQTNVRCIPGDEPGRTAYFPGQYADDDPWKALPAVARIRDDRSDGSACTGMYSVLRRYYGRRIRDLQCE